LGLSAENITFVPAADRETDLRRAFGRFGTGVTVITTQTAHGPLGMTANSFSSVSLEPPLILWSPATNSLRHNAFVSAATFCVHVLSAKQLDVARHFATQGDGFDGFDWMPTPQGPPGLRNCLAVFHCTTHAVHPAGDHSLILGQVQSVEIDHANTTPGLMFDQGRFGQFVPHNAAAQ
jgi:flavin reductase (DIM6/NTAB) family NADH-FMN oxidoreductase RutF